MKRNSAFCTPAALLAGVLFFPLVSCEKSSQQRTAAQVVAPAKYTVRGQIEAMPDPSGKGLQELQIQHERIADFKDKSGKVVGMNSMIMGFPPGPGVKIPDLKKGDKVEVDFEVTWTGKDPYYFTAIRKLPADTQLDFSK